MSAGRTSRISVFLLLIAGLALALPSAAAVDAFLQLGEVRGESKDASHRDWIDVVSTDVVASSPRDAATGQASGRRQFSPIHVVKSHDASSPALDQAFASGRVFPNATLHVHGSIWLLTDVKITGIQKQPAGKGEEVPKETVTFVYGGIKIAYKANTEPTPAPTKALLVAAAAAPAALSAAVQAPRITGVSASAPLLGTGVMVTIASTGPCTSAFVGYGDGSINEGHALTGTSTQIPVHVYSTPGLKTIQVGGRDAPYWSGQQKHDQSRAGDCTGWAETTVTLRSEAAPAPAIRR